MAEFDDPVMIVVGGGAVALSTAQELCALQGHRVVVLWRRDPEVARAVKNIGAEFVSSARPDSAEGLNGAGVRDAVSILALSPDDQLNLHAALLARDANPRIRIVLRQFNRTLGHKIEQNLPNCSVLSLAWHSAATYASAALDPSCLGGLQFPEPDGPLTGFATRIAGNCVPPAPRLRKRSACSARVFSRSTAKRISTAIWSSRAGRSWWCTVPFPGWKVAPPVHRWAEPAAH